MGLTKSVVRAKTRAAPTIPRRSVHGAPCTAAALRSPPCVLCRSKVYVLLFSVRGMQQMAEMTETSGCDNVLLEMRMARELKLRRKEQFRVFPMLLGPYERSAKFEKFNFKAKDAMFNGQELEKRDFSSPATEAKVKSKLVEMKDGLGVLTPGGIKENIDWFFKIQGLVSLDLDYDRVLDIAASKIVKISDDVSKTMDSGGSFGVALQMLKQGMFSSKDKPFEVSDKREIFVHSATFKGGTRLRNDPSKPDDFNECHLLNGDQVHIHNLKVIEGKFAYAEVTKIGNASVKGWILQRNLTFIRGKEGTLGHFKDSLPKPQKKGLLARTKTGATVDVAPANVHGH